MKIYLVAPKNPESFWTFDRILPSLKKKCVVPNLSLPTIAGITPPEHEVVLCDENVEPIDFDTDADIDENTLGRDTYAIFKGPDPLRAGIQCHPLRFWHIHQL